MAVDLLHFAFLYAICTIVLRLLQGRFAGTEWGKVLAFFG